MHKIVHKISKKINWFLNPKLYLELISFESYMGKNVDRYCKKVKKNPILKYNTLF